MIELIYPYDTAPMIPAPTADALLSPVVSCEYFPVVEPSGLVVGRSAREYCHSGAKPLHPVIHIHIIDQPSSLRISRLNAGHLRKVLTTAMPSILVVADVWQTQAIS